MTDKQVEGVAWHMNQPQAVRAGRQLGAIQPVDCGSQGADVDDEGNEEGKGCSSPLPKGLCRFTESCQRLGRVRPLDPSRVPGEPSPPCELDGILKLGITHRRLVARTGNNLCLDASCHRVERGSAVMSRSSLIISQAERMSRTSVSWRNRGSAGGLGRHEGLPLQVDGCC
jgi:hypothetical protein